MKSTWISLTLLAGSFLPIQAGMNARLGKALESPVPASFISFVVGAIAVATYGLITKEHVSAPLQKLYFRRRFVSLAIWNH
jgi:transporter family-2 protein